MSPSPTDPIEPIGWVAPPPPPPSGRWRRRFVVALLLVFLAVGLVAGAGATLTVRLLAAAPRPLSQQRQSPGPGRSPAPGPSPSLAPLPSVPPQSGRGSGPALSPATIASRVDPAVVDINVTFGGGSGAGTGMILTPTGEVLTNNHVVDGATSISVQVAGTGPQYQATVIGVDPTDDIALIQMCGASGLATVPLGDSSSLALGDQIVALGNALGRGGAPAVNPGVVSALNQTITVSDPGGGSNQTLSGMIEVRAQIQPGDSGGPIVDGSGHVVGMTTAGSARARRTGAIGYGIPTTRALTVAQQIQSGSGPNVLPGQRGIIGVTVDGRPSAVGGAHVLQVEPGSPAAGAGVAVGDVITGVDGASIDSADTLTKALQVRKPGDSVSISWHDRSSGTHTASMTLAPGPPA